MYFYLDPNSIISLSKSSLKGLKLNLLLLFSCFYLFKYLYYFGYHNLLIDSCLYYPKATT